MTPPAAANAVIAMRSGRFPVSSDAYISGYPPPNRTPLHPLGRLSPATGEKGTRSAPAAFSDVWQCIGPYNPIQSSYFLLCLWKSEEAKRIAAIASLQRAGSLAGDYSGGNKRKLSLAIALMAVHPYTPGDARSWVALCYSIKAVAFGTTFLI